MAKGKKGGKGKKSKKKDEAKAGEEEAEPEIVVHFKPEHFVTLHIKLVTWDYLNFSMTVPTWVSVFTVVEKIREQHGYSITDVVLYKEKVQPKNKITELEKTLEEVGISGAPKGTDAHCVLWYDYPPHQSQCPLLLSSPRDNSGRKPFTGRARPTSKDSGTAGGHNTDMTRARGMTMAGGGDKGSPVSMPSFGPKSAVAATAQMTASNSSSASPRPSTPSNNNNNNNNTAKGDEGSDTSSQQQQQQQQQQQHQHNQEDETAED